MTILTNTFEGGTNGVAVTSGNSGGGSGDAWTFVGPSAGSAFTYTNTPPWGGAGLACRFVPHASNSYYLRWDLAESVAGRGVMRLEMQVPAAPSGNTNLMQLRNLVSDGTMCIVAMDSSRRIFVLDGGGTTLTSLTSSAYSVGDRLVIEVAATKASSDAGPTYNGIVALRVENKTTSTIHEPTPVTTARTRTADPGQYRFFGISQSTGWTEVFFDGCRAGQQASGWLGPAGVEAPTLALDGQVVHLIDATDSSVASGSLSYAITQDSGPSATPTEISAGRWIVTPDSAASRVYLVTASGSLGGSDSGLYTVPPLTVVEVDGYDETLVYSGSAWL